MTSSRKARVEQHVEVLASVIGPRYLGRPSSLIAAQAHIRRTWESAGLVVREEPVLGEAVNLIAEVRGPKSGTFIIGAHYDTVPLTPGADDNASAVAALLELGVAFANSTPNRSLRFIAFCNEEPPYYKTGHMGSVVHARGCVRRGEKIVGMLCLEMVGYFDDTPGSQRYPGEVPGWLERLLPRRGNFLALVGEFNTLALQHRLRHGFRRGTSLPLRSLPLPKKIADACAMSDHWSFAERGIPAVMATDTSFYRNPHYHKSTDTPSTIDVDRLTQVVDGLESGITRIVGKR